jgi:hypothetical protein
MAKRGRTFEPSDADRSFVYRSVQSGARINDIADCLNVTDDTLRKHFRYEIAMARQLLIVKAVGVVDDALTDGSLDAAKYVLSRVAGWTEKTLQDHTSSDGSMSPQPTIIEIVYPEDDDEETTH